VLRDYDPEAPVSPGAPVSGARSDG